MTERQDHPYRAGPQAPRLEPRLAMPIGSGAVRQGDLMIMRAADALRIGDGWLVTMHETTWGAYNPRLPFGGQPPNHPATNTTFFVRASLEEIRAALFIEIQLEQQG